MSLSGLFLLGAIVLFVIIKTVQNHVKNKRSKRKIKLFTTRDLISVLFNGGFVIGGVVTLLIGLGWEEVLFGPEIRITQPVINILAGILFIWFGLKYLFGGEE